MCSRVRELIASPSTSASSCARSTSVAKICCGCGPWRRGLRISRTILPVRCRCSPSRAPVAQTASRWCSAEKVQTSCLAATGGTKTRTRCGAPSEHGGGGGAGVGTNFPACVCARFMGCSHGRRRRLRSIVYSLDAESHVRGLALFEKLKGVEPLEDRAFLAHCIDDLCGHLRSLLRRNDRMGMAASIEVRVPFLENRLIDLAMHLPRLAKYRNGHGKWLLKSVASKHLPRMSSMRRSWGFTSRTTRSPRRWACFRTAPHATSSNGVRARPGE